VCTTPDYELFTDSRSKREKCAFETYFLRSVRIGFRCWSPDDLPLARELWSDSEVTRFLGWPVSDEEIGQKLQREIARMNALQFQYWPIYLLSNDEPMGAADFRRTGRRIKSTNWDSI
jgi:RimJ/RimL family protein N-acetyltransferase